MKKFRISIFLTLILFIATSTWANMGNTYGFSAKGMALGNAVTASSNGWDAAYYNIAGLGKTKSNQINEKTKKPYVDEFGLNYNYYLPIMLVDMPTSPWKPGPGPAENLSGGFISLGLALDLNHFLKLPKFISSARFGLGLGLNCYAKSEVQEDGSTKFGFDMTMAKVNDIDLRSHQYLRYGRNIQHAVIELGLGFGFLDDMFGVGFGVTAFTDSDGSMLIRNPATGLGPAQPQYPYQKVEMNFIGHISPIGGFYIDVDRIFGAFDLKIPLVNDLQIAASYRGEIYMNVDPFPAVTAMDLLNTSLPMSATMFSFYTPHIVNAGLLCDFWKMFVEIDCGVELWQFAKKSPGRTEIWADRQKIAANLGVSAEQLKLYEIPNFRNVIIPRLGIGYHLFENLDLLAGYYYQPTMLTEEATSGFFNFMDNDKHVASLGVSYVLPKMKGMVSPLEINFSVQEQFLLKRHVAKVAGAETKNEDGTNASINKNLAYSYHGYVTAMMLEIVTKW